MLDPEKILPDYRGWIWRVVMNVSKDRQTQEDLAQECYYAMWEALKKYDPAKGALPSFLTVSATNRLNRVLKRDAYLGTPGVRGHRREAAAVPIDTTPNPTEESGGWIDRQLSTTLGDVELAYHHGEIMDAIRTLTPKQQRYVYYRFWHQMTNPEIRQIIGGGDPSGHWTHPERGARARLAARLGDLADAV